MVSIIIIIFLIFFPFLWVSGLGFSFLSMGAGFEWTRMEAMRASGFGEWMRMEVIQAPWFGEFEEGGDLSSTV